MKHIKITVIILIVLLILQINCKRKKLGKRANKRKRTKYPIIELKFAV